MRVLVLGADGYLGWATCMHLSALGHEVAGVDNYFRRDAARRLDLPPLLDPPALPERARVWRQASGRQVRVEALDVCDLTGLGRLCKELRPQAVVHYAEQPSAPYSMMGPQEAHFTLVNNLVSTLNLAQTVGRLDPAIHIVKLGTMGVYGTPNIDIEEGYLTVTHKGRTHTFLYPKTPGSLYHLTKAQDSDLLYFYTRTWDLAVTDLNQGPVYGLFTDEAAADERLLPPFSYDDVFGTVLNRFVTQAAAGLPLTVYGAGGQRRGYINLKDTLSCVRLALERPAAKGEYRVFNQFTQTFSVLELAEMVRRAGESLGLKVEVRSIPNPRREEESHYYNPVHQGLAELGLEPHFLTEEVLQEMLRFVMRHRERVRADLMAPRVSWAVSGKPAL